MSNNGGGQHWRKLRVDGDGDAVRVHHPQTENQAVVDLGLLVVTDGVWHESSRRERVSCTSVGDSASSSLKP